MNKNKLKIKEVVNLDQAIDYMESIVESIRSGKIEIEHGQESISLTTDNTVGLELEISQKDGKRELSMELTWKADLKTPRKLDLRIFGMERSKPSFENTPSSGVESIGYEPTTFSTAQGEPIVGLETVSGLSGEGESFKSGENIAMEKNPEAYFAECRITEGAEQESPGCSQV